MGDRRAKSMECAADGAAALLFAVAVGYAIAATPIADLALRLAMPGLAFAASFYGLRRISPAEAFRVPDFEAAAIATIQPEELVLTDADRLNPQELLLDRSLVHIGPGSRVVRLFEPAAMPTPGELKARIDCHLAASPSTAPPDESQALFEALADLRRALR